MRSHSRFVTSRGFTLIEMMIVVLVIAILALIVGFAVRNAGDRTRESTRIGLLHDLNGAVTLYQIDCNAYPDTLANLLDDSGPGNHQGSPYYGRGSVIPPDPVTGNEWVYDNTTGIVTAP